MDDTTIGGWLAWYRPGCNGTIMDALSYEKAPSQKLRGALGDYFGSILAERGKSELTFTSIRTSPLFPLLIRHLQSS
ncbi:hypothetical protein THICB2_10010 [Thiomonas sp. CB2]|nr:hypothetical protein THICB2_10010 [Thiomonas sp. CB2]VDY06618.1 protein of unknown function [Thiomonas sp. Bio17B3]VDY10086.1 protein of unknown function [Thiomonas sp. Sup16B3]VDY14890.1 conserved protein of unknown function [Thiomonas sp. OC7]VDY15931.1 protein of unknown function [Thiomonas sp. CB2]